MFGKRLEKNVKKKAEEEESLSFSSLSKPAPASDAAPLPPPSAPYAPSTLAFESIAPPRSAAPAIAPQSISIAPNFPADLLTRSSSPAANESELAPQIEGLDDLITAKLGISSPRNEEADDEDEEYVMIKSKMKPFVIAKPSARKMSDTNDADDIEIEDAIVPIEKGKEVVSDEDEEDEEAEEDNDDEEEDDLAGYLASQKSAQSKGRFDFDDEEIMGSSNAKSFSDLTEKEKLFMMHAKSPTDDALRSNLKRSQAKRGGRRKSAGGGSPIAGVVTAAAMASAKESTSNPSPNVFPSATETRGSRARLIDKKSSSSSGTDLSELAKKPSKQSKSKTSAKEMRKSMSDEKFSNAYDLEHSISLPALPEEAQRGLAISRSVSEESEGSALATGGIFVMESIPTDRSISSGSRKKSPKTKKLSTAHLNFSAKDAPMSRQRSMGEMSVGSRQSFAATSVISKATIKSKISSGSSSSSAGPSGKPRKGDAVESENWEKAKEIIAKFVGRKSKEKGSDTEESSNGEYDSEIEKEKRQAEDELNLQGLSLSNIPFQGTISELSERVRILKFGKNKLQAIPNKLRLLIKLEELSLFNNNLDDESFDVDFTPLVALRTIDLSGNALTQLPGAFAALTNLRTLNLHSNEIKTVSDERTLFILRAIGRTLKSFNLGHNKLTNIGDAFCEALPELVSLRLQGNELESLPKTIVNMKKLQVLKVEYNPLLHPPLPVCLLGISDIAKYFESHSRGAIALNVDTLALVPQQPNFFIPSTVALGPPPATVPLVALDDVHSARNEGESNDLFGEMLIQQDENGMDNKNNNRSNYSNDKNKDQSEKESSNNNGGGNDNNKQNNNGNNNNNNGNNGDDKKENDKNGGDGSQKDDDPKKGGAAQITKRRKFKLILIGSPLSGKTSLLQSLIRNEVYLVHKENRTIGIDIGTLDIDPEAAMSLQANDMSYESDLSAYIRSLEDMDDDQFRVYSNPYANATVSEEIFQNGLPGVTVQNSVGASMTTAVTEINEPNLLPVSWKCWDFAGQKVYLGTHQFFFSNEALYVLVCDSNECGDVAKMDSNIFFWLYSVQNRVPGAVIHLVLTKIAGKSEDELRSLHKNIMKRFISLEKDRKDELRSAIDQQVNIRESNQPKRKSNVDSDSFYAEEGAISEEETRLRNLLEKRPRFQPICSFVSVSEERGVFELKKRLLLLSTQRHLFHQLSLIATIPASYQVIIDHIATLREKNMKLISVEGIIRDVEHKLQIINEKIPEKCVLPCLNYLHYHGEILLHQSRTLGNGKYDHSLAVVFLDPQWLVCMIKRLVNHSNIQLNEDEEKEAEKERNKVHNIVRSTGNQVAPRMLTHLETLKSKSILSEELLKFLWPELYQSHAGDSCHRTFAHQVLDILDRFDICHEIEFNRTATEQSRSFLVPCLLTKLYKPPPLTMAEKKFEKQDPTNFEFSELEASTIVKVNRRYTLFGFPPPGLISSIISRFCGPSGKMKEAFLHNPIAYCDAVMFQSEETTRELKFDMLIHMKSSARENFIDVIATGPIASVIKMWRSIFVAEQVIQSVIQNCGGLSFGTYSQCPVCLLFKPRPTDPSQVTTINLSVIDKTRLDECDIPSTNDDIMNLLSEAELCEKDHYCPCVLLYCPSKWMDSFESQIVPNENKRKSGRVNDKICAVGEEYRAVVRIGCFLPLDGKFATIGTGFVYDADNGLIMTVAHLIMDPRSRRFDPFLYEVTEDGVYVKKREFRSRDSKIYIGFADNPTQAPKWMYAACVQHCFASVDLDEPFIDIAILKITHPINELDRPNAPSPDIYSTSGWVFEEGQIGEHPLNYQLDLALGENFVPIRLRERVYAVGYPAKVTDLLVIETKEVNQLDDYLIGVVMLSESGGSGSPLFNNQAQVVGIMSYSRGQGSTSLAHFVSLQASAIKDLIIAKCMHRQ